MSIQQTLERLKAKRRMREKIAAAYYPYLYKEAAQPPMPPMDPAMMGGAPPMDPAMMGGMPPMDPAMMGGMPPGPMPPMDPAMMGGMPPMDPAMMGGMPPAPPAPAPPASGQPATPQEAEQKATNKVKTEQWMQHIDSYNYNLLKLMINLYEHLGIPVPAESLLPAPLGESAPSAGDISGMMGAAANATSPQSPTDAMAEGDVTPPSGGAGGGMGGLDPAMLGGGGMPPMEGGDVKQSSWNLYDPYTGMMNTRWSSPFHKQAGVSPYVGNTDQSMAYLDVLNKLRGMRYFG